MHDAIVLNSKDECEELKDVLVVDSDKFETPQRDKSGIYNLEEAWDQNFYAEEQSTLAIQEVATSGGYNPELYKETGVLTIRNRLDLSAACMHTRNG